MSSPAIDRGRPVILHLSADFPDRIRGRTTPAVRDFVAEVQEADHVVVSLSRRSDPRRISFREDERMGAIRVLVYGYWGLPFGIAHAASLWLAARRIHRWLREEKVAPDLLHAHKLTFEGFIAWHLARWLAVPYVASIRGEADSKILRFKPTYRPWVAAVARRARRLYAVSMWFVPRLERLDAGLSSAIRPLPNFVGWAKPEPARPPPDPPVFVSVLDLGALRKKGLLWLLRALRSCGGQLPGATLDLIGWTTPAAKRKVGDMIRREGLAGRVRLRGALPNERILSDLPGYTALLLPSVNETFGMVYVEALLAGIPILYTAGTGIDGHLDGLEIGVKVKPGAVDEITDGMVRLAQEAPWFRARIRNQQHEIRRRFCPELHVDAYMRDVRQIIESRGSHSRQ